MPTIVDVFIIAVIILSLDVVWILANKKHYKDTIMSVQGSQLNMNYLGVIGSYFLVIVSIAFISIPMIKQNIKKLSSQSHGRILLSCLKYSGLLGLCIYGIFNFTNIAIFTKYDYVTAIKDTCWGVLLYTLVPFLYFSFILSYS